MKRCGLLSLAIILAVSPAALSQTPGEGSGSAKQQVVSLTAQWLRAEETRNLAFLEKLLAPDFSVMTGSGHTMNKAALLAALRSPGLIMRGLRSDPISVRVYGNVAILIDRTTIGGARDGKPFGSVVRFVRIYVRQRGTWRAEYAQATLLKDAAGS